MQGREMHIFDTQSYLYAGGFYSRRRVSLPVEQSGGMYRAMEMDVSSSVYLMNEISKYRKPGVDLVFAFDSPPWIKRNAYRELFGINGYKDGRAEKPIWLEPNKMLCYEMLKQIGLNTFMIENYESDDIIASIVKYYRKDYEHIYVHTRDSDLTHLVGDNVTIEPCNRQGKHIDIYNYEESVKKDCIVRYNTAIVNRLCFKAKDNVPLVPKKWRSVIDLGIPKDVYSKCGDSALLRVWVSRLTNDDPMVMGIYDLIVPIILDGELVELEEEEFNITAYNYYATMLGCEGTEYLTTPDYPTGEETFLRWIKDYKERGGE